MPSLSPMSTINNVRRPSTSKRWLIIGSVLLVIGVAGILRFVLEGTNTPVEGDPQADAAWQSITIIGSALCTGIGLVMVTLGLIKRRRGARKPSDTA